MERNRIEAIIRRTNASADQMRDAMQGAGSVHGTDADWLDLKAAAQRAAVHARKLIDLADTKLPG